VFSSFFYICSEYIPTTRLRYLFAVDNAYVASKLKTIMLPFFKTEWHTKFQNDANNPVCPKYRTNLIHSSFFCFLETTKMRTTCIFLQWVLLHTFFSLDTVSAFMATLVPKNSVNMQVVPLDGLSSKFWSP
jgi:hypothetical protein